MITNNLFPPKVRNFIEPTVTESSGKVVDKIVALKNTTEKMSEKQGGGKGTEFKDASNILGGIATEVRAVLEKPAVNKVFRN